VAQDAVLRGAAKSAKMLFALGDRVTAARDTLDVVVKVQILLPQLTSRCNCSGFSFAQFDLARYRAMMKLFSFEVTL
jgi:hypothetical protein